MRPVAIDLFSGLGGWTEGLTAAGWYVIRFDLEDMCRLLGEPHPEHSSLVIQDVLTIHGSQFKNVGLIVSSSPCQDFSYRAMPWSRAKALHAPFLGMWLFWAQFRIQHEASKAAGRHIPMVCENVRGAIPWVGRSRANFGSYHLWGDVPALMPSPAGRVNKAGIAHRPDGATNFHRDLNNGRKNPGLRFDGSGAKLPDGQRREGMKTDGSEARRQTKDGRRIILPEVVAAGGVAEGRKHHGDWFRDPDCPTRQGGQSKVAEGRKGAGAGAEWFDGNLCVKSSRSPARKAASAKIAKIPLRLAEYIGWYWHPDRD